MYTTKLRKVGGSVMMAVPPAILDMLHLDKDSTIGLTVDNGHIIATPSPRPQYTLAELLAQCDKTADITPEDRKWLDIEPSGNELI